MRGHQWLEELWESYVPNELDEEFAATLLTLSFFASPDIAEAFRKETVPDQSLEALATRIRPIFPKALAEYDSALTEFTCSSNGIEQRRCAGVAIAARTSSQAAGRA